MIKLIIIIIIIIIIINKTFYIMYRSFSLSLIDGLHPVYVTVPKHVVIRLSEHF